MRAFFWTAAVLCLTPTGASSAADGPIDPNAGASDQVKLRDGRVVLGQVVAAPAGGSVELIVRRAWAEKAVPELAARWTAEHGRRETQARARRKTRLETWKRQRAGAGADDPIVRYVDRELERLAEADASTRPLMFVSLKRADVKEIVRRPAAATRRLRLAWSCSFDAAETATFRDLGDSLTGRGFDLSRDEPAELDDMLPTPIETDEQWLTRRAATEVLHDDGLRFVQMGPMVVPDPTATTRRGPAAEGLPRARSFSFSRGGGLGGEMGVEGALREAAARGRVGAVVARQEVGPNLDAASAESTLWVRLPNGQWKSKVSVAASAKAKDMKKDAPDGDASGTFSFESSFSFSSNPGGDETRVVKRSHPKLGAARKKADDDVRDRFEARLDALALPIGPK